MVLNLIRLMDRAGFGSREALQAQLMPEGSWLGRLETHTMVLGLLRILKASKSMLPSLFGFLFAALSFVQVPQWSNDWSKCSVAVPDTACHWYVVNPDNTFGKGFSWLTAPKFDVTALRDIGVQHDVTVAQGFQTTVELMNATTEVKYGDNY